MAFACDVSSVSCCGMLISSIRYGVCTFLLSFFGYFYPAINTIRAVLSVESDRNDESIAEWLTYWIVLTVFYLLEVVVDLFMWHVPLYLEMKVAIVCWLTFPQSQGTKIY